jgi:hypothetical protein
MRARTMPLRRSPALTQWLWRLRAAFQVQSASVCVLHVMSEATLRTIMGEFPLVEHRLLQVALLWAADCLSSKLTHSVSAHAHGTNRLRCVALALGLTVTDCKGTQAASDLADSAAA